MKLAIKENYSTMEFSRQILSYYYQRFLLTNGDIDIDKLKN